MMTAAPSRSRTLLLYLLFFLASGMFIVTYKEVSEFLEQISAMSDEEFRAEHRAASPDYSLSDVLLVRRKR
jgi:hypothetical protein